jgi:hypothetical protein
MIKLTDLLKEVEDTKYTIYCNMDGVLVDFEEGYEKLTGINIRGRHVKGDEKFWEPRKQAGAAFWIRLKWMPDGKQLWDYINKYNPILLSAPSKEESSRVGKRVWVKRNLPGVKLILRPASQKQQFSGENKILIDDREDNIEQWRNKGGIGILHTSASNTIKQLKELEL